MTSSNFFTQSLFHFEQEKQQATELQKQTIAPWTSDEPIPLKKPKSKKKIQKKLIDINQEQQKKVVKLQSNLLPIKKQIIKVSLIPKLPFLDRARNRSFQQKSRGIPIQQYLSQRRQQSIEEDLHQKSIAIINKSIQNNFLAKRNTHKKHYIGYSKTIDIKRDIYNPLEIYRSQQVVDIFPRKLSQGRRDLSNVLERYKPIKSQRYHL